MSSTIAWRLLLLLFQYHLKGAHVRFPAVVPPTGVGTGTLGVLNAQESSHTPTFLSGSTHPELKAAGFIIKRS